MDLNALTPHSRKHCHLSGPDEGTCSQNAFALAHVLASISYVVSPADRFVDKHVASNVRLLGAGILRLQTGRGKCAALVGVFEGDDRIRAGREGRACHDAEGSAALHAVTRTWGSARRQVTRHTKASR